MMTATTKDRRRVPRKPLRVSVTTASELLDIGLDQVRALIHDGTFTELAPHGRGRGRRLYLYPDEVEAFATGGRAAVLKIRKREGRLPKKTKGKNQ